MVRAADLVLYNANVITMNPRHPRAQAVAIRDGRIIEVGGNSLVEKYSHLKDISDDAIFERHPGRKDCQGQTLVPGFIDAHCHLFAFARSLLGLDVGPSSTRSIEEIKALINSQAHQVEKGTWIYGSGYHEFYFPEKRHPTRWDLDQAAPHHPVLLVHRTWHACVLNSLGLKLAGIGRHTPDPPGGVIDRDHHTAEPTGILYEMVPYVERFIPSPTPGELEKGVALADQRYRGLGITSIQEASHTNDLARWQQVKGFQERGLLRTRVTLMLGAGALEEAERQGLRQGYGDPNLCLGPVKVVLTTTTGRLDPPQERLNEIALTAQRLGWQLAIHSLEVDTLEAAIVALERAQREYPRPHLRHRIEHCSLCPPPLLERLKGLGALVVTQPPFIYYSGQRYLEEVPSQEQPWLYRIGSFYRAGLRPAASSDSPVVPNNPLIGIYSAIARREAGGEVLQPQESVSAQQALAMYTINAAHACRQELEKGSIEAGKLADLVLLSHDPTTVPPETIKDIRVEMTILGGLQFHPQNAKLYVDNGL
ncbi:MAG TPA: amidohydrolase [Dehalococcoidia bacterium]|nr:amidohydrolase [Dehalococcoidia bacterium]